MRTDEAQSANRMLLAALRAATEKSVDVEAIEHVNRVLQFIGYEPTPENRVLFMAVASWIMTMTRAGIGPYFETAGPI